MSAVDWLLLAIVVVSALFGLMRGFVGVLASLVAWVLAAWVAFHFGAQLGVLLAGAGEPSAGQVLAGYALSFLGVLVVVGLAGWVVRRIVHSIGLTGIDRLLGLLLGVVRGAFVACALVLLLGLTSMPREPSWRDSAVVPVFVPGAQWLSAWLPGWVAQQMQFGAGSDGLIDQPASDNGPASLPVPPSGSGRAS